MSYLYVHSIVRSKLICCRIKPISPLGESRHPVGNLVPLQPAADQFHGDAQA